MKTEDIKKFYDEFQPPKGFIIPADFPIARHYGVLIQRIAKEESSVFFGTGIIIPVNTRMNRYVGRIYAVGHDIKDLKVGMKVIYNALADQSILYKGTEYTTMSGSDVYYILPEDAETVYATVHKEGRKQYDHDEMPDIAESKESIQEQNELRKERTEIVTKNLKRKVHGYKGNGKNG